MARSSSLNVASCSDRLRFSRSSPRRTGRSCCRDIVILGIPVSIPRYFISRVPQGAYALVGQVAQNRAPPNGDCEITTSPPCHSMARFTIASPSPNPVLLLRL